MDGCGPQPLSTTLSGLIFTGHNSWVAETKNEHSNVVMGSEIFFSVAQSFYNIYRLIDSDDNF